MTKYLHLFYGYLPYIEHAYGATLFMGNSEDKNSSILVQTFAIIIFSVY